MKRIIIFGNGKLHRKFLQEIKAGDIVIGVDRAAYWLLTHKIIPDVAIGDFDSVNKKELRFIKKSIKTVEIYPRKKDFTDMELAVAYAKKYTPDRVRIYGATGTRIDHMLATIHLLDTQEVIDENNRIRLVSRGKTIVERSSYRYISILPYTNSISLSLTGFRYNADRKTIKRGMSLGVSNEIIGKAGVIEIVSGKAWVIESND